MSVDANAQTTGEYEAVLLQNSAPRPEDAVPPEAELARTCRLLETRRASLSEPRT